MCFICNDTKTIYVPGDKQSFNEQASWEFSIAVDCPICYEQEENIFQYIEKILNNAVKNNKPIYKILLSTENFTKLQKLTILSLKDGGTCFPSFLIKGVSIEVNDGINDLEVWYDE